MPSGTAGEEETVLGYLNSAGELVEEETVLTIGKEEDGFTVSEDGKTYTKDILFGLIYSGNRVAGMELETKRKAAIDDGMFNVLIVDYVPTVFNAPDLLSTILQQDKFIHRYRCKAITLEFEEDVVWTLDGEEAKVKDKAEIFITNKALRILA